jgi:hypothetical protein
MGFAVTTSAPTPKTKNIRRISLLTAAFFVVLAVTQLFTFERFAEVIELAYGIFDSRGALVLSACIVTLEVAALPFFLAMPLSRAARFVSMTAGWVTIATWLALSLWQLLNRNESTALFGATLDVPGGWWTVCFVAALGVLVAWTNWGMWPLSTKLRK